MWKMTSLKSKYLTKLMIQQVINVRNGRIFVQGNRILWQENLYDADSRKAVDQNGEMALYSV
jgi:hypothetical protein